jgi:hypothetical protein
MSPDCPAERDPVSISDFELRRALLLRFTSRREEPAVGNAFLELAVFFFVAVGFLAAAFFSAGFFAFNFLPEVGLDFFAFLPFFLVAICAV